MNAIIATLFRFAAPVGFAAVGETVGQRAGVINVGLEGMMLSASYFAMLACQRTQNPFFGLLAGVGIAVALGLFAALFTIGLGQDQVVVGTAINLLSLGATATLYRQAFGASGQLISVPKFPLFGGDWDVVLISLLILAPAIFIVMRRTKWGLAVRAAGEYPEAVQAAGLSVFRLRVGASLISAGFAGLAGSYLALGVTGSFAENMTAGRGFVALALVTFGRWNPIGVVAAALLIGAADWGQYILQAQGIGLPPQLLRSLPYLLALGVLVIAGKGTRPPAALGVALKGNKD